MALFSGGFFPCKFVTLISHNFRFFLFFIFEFLSLILEVPSFFPEY